MPYWDFGNFGLSELNSYRIKFFMRTAAGAAVSGITTITVYRAKNDEFPAVSLGALAVIASPGPHGATPPTIVEVDPTNFRGLYEINLRQVDCDSKGSLALRFVDTTPGTAEDTNLIVPYLLRSAVLVG